MRDGTARALSWVLSVLTLLTVLFARRPGRHSAEYLAALTPEPEPAPVNPWSLPWPGPTKEEAAAFFRQQAGATLDPRAVTRQQLRAAAFAALGMDCPYPHGGADAFGAAAGMTA